jgi:dihydrofolate reductase
MKISLIVAMSSNRVIGYQNRMPWHLSADLKRFKALTRYSPVLMGRKTFESIGKPLVERTNIILSQRWIMLQPVVSFFNRLKTQWSLPRNVERSFL